MKKILSMYEQAWKELRREQKNGRAGLALHEELFTIAEEYADKFSPVHEWVETGRFSIASYDAHIWNHVRLRLYISEEDKADCVHPIIDAMIADPRLDLRVTPPKEIKDTQTANWYFIPKGSEHYIPRLEVLVFYDRSESCKLVPTGRFSERREIMK